MGIEMDEPPTKEEIERSIRASGPEGCGHCRQIRHLIEHGLQPPGGTCANGHQLPFKR